MCGRVCKTGACSLSAGPRSAVSTRRGRRTNTLEAEPDVVVAEDGGKLATGNGEATVSPPAEADRGNTSGGDTVASPVAADKRTNTPESGPGLVVRRDVGKLATDNGEAVVASPAADDKRNASGKAKDKLTTVLKFTAPSPWNSVYVWHLDNLSDDHFADGIFFTVQCTLQVMMALFLVVSYPFGLHYDTRMHATFVMLASLPGWAAISLLVFWPTRVPSEPGEEGTRVAFVYRSYVSAAAGIATFFFYACVHIVVGKYFPVVKLSDDGGPAGEHLFSWCYLIWILVALGQFSVGAYTVLRGPVIYLVVKLGGPVYNLVAQFTSAVVRSLPRISIYENAPRTLMVKPKVD